MGAFCAQYPNLRLDLTLSDRRVDLIEEGYDVAVRIGQLADSTLISRRLATVRMRLCTAPAYIDRYGSPRHLTELRDHSIWAYRHFVPGDDWPFVGPDGPTNARVRPVVRTNNGDTCVIGALAGHCIVLQPDFLVGTHLRSGRLVALLPA